MDWAALPPEINSARMYAGAGSISLIQAAGAWATLAAGLGSTSESISRVVAGLTEVWRGPSSLSMQTAALTYQAWLTETAAIAQGTASQAMAAAAAHETALAATIPPALIAENRTQLSTLLATNFLGINIPAIMENEVQYLEMWVQDALAMYEYQAASAQATLLPAFQSLADLTTGAIQDPTTGWAGLANQYITALVSSGAPIDILGLFSSMWTGNGTSQPEPVTVDPTLPTATPPSTAQSSAVSASLGTAGKAGNLSIPQGWARSISPQFTPIEQVTPLNSDELVGLPGIPVLGAGPKQNSEPARYGFRNAKVIPRHPSAG